MLPISKAHLCDSIIRLREFLDTFRMESSDDCVTFNLVITNNCNQSVTLPETNSSPLKIGACGTTFLLRPGLFSGAMAVSFREGMSCLHLKSCDILLNDNPSTNILQQIAIEQRRVNFTKRFRFWSFHQIWVFPNIGVGPPNHPF